MTNSWRAIHTLCAYTCNVVCQIPPLGYTSVGMTWGDYASFAMFYESVFPGVGYNYPDTRKTLAALAAEIHKETFRKQRVQTSCTPYKERLKAKRILGQPRGESPYISIDK